MLIDELTVKSMSDYLYVFSSINFLLWAVWLYCLLLLLYKSFINVTLFSLFSFLSWFLIAVCPLHYCFPVNSFRRFTLLLTFFFPDMLMFQPKLSRMSSIFIIIFLCNTLILLLSSSSCLTFYTTPLSPILETITWIFYSQKFLILPVPPRWVIFLTRTRSPGWRLSENLEELCCMSLFFLCFDMTL